MNGDRGIDCFNRHHCFNRLTGAAGAPAHPARCGARRARGTVTQVTARGKSTVISSQYHSLAVQVFLADLAAHVDRRKGLVLRRAEEVPS